MNPDTNARCMDLVETMIDYFKTNDMTKMTPQTIELVNTIRDMCIDSNPISVNVTKKFDNETNLINYYTRLNKELGGVDVPDTIFQPSFVLTQMKAYANKFCAGNLSQTAYYLSLAFEYMMASAVARNQPLPLATDERAQNYMTLLLQQADIPHNLQTAIASRKFKSLNMVSDLVNNVIDDIFTLESNNYYRVVLNEKNKGRVISFRENMNDLGPFNETKDVFRFIAKMVASRGIKPPLIENATSFNFISIKDQNKTTCQQSLTELAFQNEALRRFMFQKLSYKNKSSFNSDQPPTSQQLDVAASGSITDLGIKKRKYID